MRGARLARAAWDIWRAERGGTPAIEARQKARLASMITWARRNSQYYRELYRNVADPVVTLQSLPPVRKPDLMAHFDEWVTDPGVNRAGADAFVADLSLIGHAYRSQYAVWTTSGSTGTPAIFLHDAGAQNLYESLLLVRGWPTWTSDGRLAAFLRRGLREAWVVATEGHFAGVSLHQQVRLRNPWLASSLRAFSVLQPLGTLLAELDAFQPTILAGYPSAIQLISREQNAGRLRLSPLLVLTSGEGLTAPTRREIGRAFNCPVYNLYAASEFPCIALECLEGGLHLNADWVILEAVDEENQAVPRGQESHTVLLTNLVNRIQPLIRYDLGDSITFQDEPCRCGRALPIIQVEGRSNEILTLRSATGEPVHLLPLAVAAVIEQSDGVRRFQVIQTGPSRLRVRLEVEPGSEQAAVEMAVEQRLRAYLLTHGLPSVEIERAEEPPTTRTRGGKFRQVWSEVDTPTVRTL